jgi:hypothetical protein
MRKQAIGAAKSSDRKISYKKSLTKEILLAIIFSEGREMPSLNMLVVEKTKHA